jgi:hypothetical protein
MRKALLSALMSVFACAAFALPKVAILNPTLDKTMSADIGSAIVDKVQEVLLKSKKYSIVDRNSRDAVWEERNFQLSSGEIDQSQIKSIGQGLGADFVVVVKVKKVGSLYAMSTSMIDVETLEVVGQASAEAKEPIENVLKLSTKCGAALAEMEYEEGGSDEEPVTLVSKQNLAEISQSQADVRRLLEEKSFLTPDGQQKIIAKLGGITAVDRYNMFDNYKKDTPGAVIGMVLNAVLFIPVGSIVQGDLGGFFGILGADAGAALMVVGAVAVMEMEDYETGAVLVLGATLLFTAAYVYGYIAPFVYVADYNKKLARALNVTASIVPKDLGVRLAAAPGGGGRISRIEATLVSLNY